MDKQMTISSILILRMVTTIIIILIEATAPCIACDTTCRILIQMASR